MLLVSHPSVTELVSDSWPRLVFLVAKGGHVTQFWPIEHVPVNVPSMSATMVALLLLLASSIYLRGVRL